jgi:hypothetical protein
MKIRIRKNSKIKNAYIAGLCMLFFGLLVGVLGKSRYEYGAPEQYTEGRTGARYIPASLPGSTVDKIWMYAGFSVSFFAILVLIVTGLIQITFLTIKSRGTEYRT